MGSEGVMKSGEKVRFPRVGAFEVFFNQKTIYSKLEIGQWPNAQAIANKIKSAIEE
jgi:selT/selW/selH-like putative selenoprotein